MKLITIRSYDNYFYANIMLTKLQDAGVDCILKDENTVTIDPLLSNAIGGIKLTVKENDLPEALKLLQQFDEEYMKMVPCPKCGAASITQINKPGVKNFLTAITTWLFSNYAVATEQVYLCSNCGYESKMMPTSIDENELQD